MAVSLPKRFEKFLKEFPEVAVAYERLGEASHKSGDLTERERALVKLSLAVALRSEGAVHAHVRKALKLGLKKNEIRQVAILAIPTVGFPVSMAALSWMDDILDKKKGK